MIQGTAEWTETEGDKDMYKNMVELFEEFEGKGTIGAFNVHCLEMVPAMIKAAEEMQVPIILQTSLGTAEYIGFELLVAVVRALAEKEKVSTALQAIDCGYSSVMYDGSVLPLEENIQNTKRVVSYARAHNVSVEGEVGAIGGTEDGVVLSKDENMYTRLEDAMRFARETGVDALAVSIGTTHGQYKSKAKINYELLDDLRAELGDVRLVLHGGTGVADEDMRQCVKKGMKKINVGTELNKSYIDVVRTTFTSDEVTPLTSLRRLLGPANDRVKEIIKEKMVLFQL